jgi:adenosylmethionine-8-amino-7-oxononanoate aminotransferase
MSKGITGGFLPLGATSCSEQIFNAFISDDKANTFYHGHSYTANPLACAAANASLDLLEKEETQKQIIVITEFFKRMQNKLKNHSALTDIRQIGTILALELKSHEGTSYLNPLSERIAKFYLEHGIIVRPLGNVLYFIPPYCISETELKLIETCTDKFLKSLV